MTLAGCQRATAPAANPEATFTGRWIGESWEGDANASLYHVGGTAGDTMYLFGKRRLNAGEDEVVRVRIAFRGVGTYPLSADDVSLDRILGGDVSTMSFQGVGPTAGTLEVTSYGTGGVEGTLTFDARVTRIASAPVVRFENGRFRAPVVVWP